MGNQPNARADKPRTLTIVQILLYAAAVLNIANGFISFASTDMLKKLLSAAMVLFGIAALLVASRLSIPKVVHLRAAIVLSSVLLVLRIAEYAVWHNIGFLLGAILPILVIWRLNDSDVKTWFKS
ncbi:hypothetical protein [Cohnella terricola]|uniref:Uncharacterized protein n=1 Tax=Cohnella terricola TaxID=1289167 RepID=A0A559JWW1_9BACL|nr:hypothetical protein [Cohnella terricola]TVY04290.1 hypothetical protein FPZ45_01465 [Cohnella terricola]